MNDVSPSSLPERQTVPQDAVSAQYGTQGNGTQAAAATLYDVLMARDDSRRVIEQMEATLNNDPALVKQYHSNLIAFAERLDQDVIKKHGLHEAWTDYQCRLELPSTRMNLAASPGYPLMSHEWRMKPGNDYLYVREIDQKKEAERMERLEAARYKREQEQAAQAAAAARRQAERQAAAQLATLPARITSSSNGNGKAPRPAEPTDTFAQRHKRNTAHWGERKLPSLTRRLTLFQRCIAHLAARERNTLRRMSKVRHIHDRLKLFKEVKPADMGQMIMEALDEQTGNIFQPLTAADRAAMTPPVVEWLIPNAIPSNDLAIIGGRAKTGKTRLATFLTKCLLRGEDFLGFGTPPAPRTVILVTDDQADGDTADMLSKAGVHDHPQLVWSRRFRLTANNIDRLLLCIKENPGAVVIIDSLRSITRSSPYSENDPEIGPLIYDLKQAVIDAGGSLVLVHHCNKSNDLVGVEALSGHNAIPGSANTVLTLHYLTEGKRLLKNIPDRRLVIEGRSTPPADLVARLDVPTCSYALIGDYEELMERKDEDTAIAKDIAKVRAGTEELKQALRYLQGRFKGDTAPGAGLLDICKIIGVAPMDCKVTRDMDDEQLTVYRKLGRNLEAIPSIVIQATMNASSGSSYKTYALTPEGAEWITAEYNL